jgi:hypothetical protein
MDMRADQWRSRFAGRPEWERLDFAPEEYAERQARTREAPASSYVKLSATSCPVAPVRRSCVCASVQLVRSHASAGFARGRSVRIARCALPSIWQARRAGMS